MLKTKNKFIILLTTFTLLTLSSCDIDLGFNTSISTNTDSSFENEAVYEGSIGIKTTNTSVLSDDNFLYTNLNASVISEGYISKSGNNFIIGNNLEGGSLTFRFLTPIQVDQIDLKVFSYLKSSLTATIAYNDSNFEAILTKSSMFTKTFENSISLNSIKIEATKSTGSIKFDGINFSLHEVIPVEGIEKIKDVETYVGRYKTIDSSYYQVVPNTATYKDVKISSNSDFVEIEGNRIKCLQEGSYSIVVTTIDGNYSTSLNVIAEIENIPEAVNKLYKEDIRFTYDDTYHTNSALEGVLPSIGSPTVIVVPVNFSDLISIYDFNDETNIDRLNAVFNGTKEDYTNSYSHSLRSFYNESSYGALDINCVIADVFTPSFTSTSFVSKENRSDGGGTYEIIEEFYQKGAIGGTKINFKDAKFDINNDGFVDGIWFVYNDNRSTTTANFWPYTYWYYALDDNGYILDSDINISVYANMSVYFTYEDSDVGEDYHTLVHETGHMMGLDDYYSYDDKVSHSATGELDMMDANVGDHNAFSKFSLGWVEPYVVKNEGEITLNPFESSGDCLIIPSSYFNNSAFSEYIIIEFYTPTGINELDAYKPYTNGVRHFSEIGIRIFHIDARLLKLNYSNQGYYSSGEYLDVDSSNLNTSDYSYYAVGSSNTKSYSYNGYYLIEAITENNLSTYNYGSVSNKSLFKEGDTFDSNTYTSFFTNGKMHDGKSLGYKVEIKSMHNDYCTLNIIKL